MADQSFIEKEGNAVEGDSGVEYKIRKIGFPVAVVLCLLLLVVCIVLAVLYSQEVTKTRTTPEEPKYEICDEEPCFRIGMELVKSMDKNVDPCKNFYAYACRGWQNDNPVKNGSKVPHSRVPLLGEDDEDTLKKALLTPKANYSQNAAVLKTLRFYDSCMNTSAADAKGLQPLKHLVQEYGGWSVSSNIDPSLPLTTRIGKTFRELNVKTLFTFSVKVDPLNPTKRILQLSRPNIGMQYYDARNSSTKKHKDYKHLLKTVGSAFSGSNSSDDKMMAIYDFEMRIAKIFWDTNPTKSRRSTNFAGQKSRKRRSSDSTEPQMSLSSFCNASGIPWPFFQKTLTIIFARDFSGNEDIVLSAETHTNFFNNLYSLLQKTNESVVVDYIMWHVIREYGEALPGLYRSILPIAKNVTRSTECIHVMSSPFDITIGVLYTDLVIKNNQKKKLENVFVNIRSAFIDRLERDTWMDPRTRENAEKKALAMKGNIAYPWYFKNATVLQKLYESLNITDNFFLNFKAVSHFKIMRNLNTYGLPVDRDEWELDSIYTVNAYYLAQSNKIVVPAGIIKPPFYSPGYPMYLVYGGIGMVIGHEITHGFDGTGRKYDSIGKEQDWWTKTSSEKFEQKAKCLEEQYDQYSVFDKKINGTITLNENIADNGGIRFAYEAYQRWTKENGVEKILPGLTLSPDQLFFVGFAQMWCYSFNEASAYDIMQADPLHSFPKYRVVGPLVNFDKFSEAFNCPANSPMNPSSKCIVW